MTGLTFPRDVKVEMFLAGWKDITTTVRQTSPITITRGRNDEQSKVAPSRLSLTLENGPGDYVPENPVGQYFGLLGPNTPVRMSLGFALDAFGRTVSNGWGTADSGGAWGVVGTASQFAVGSGTATQSVSGTNTFLAAHLSDLPTVDAYVKVDYTPSFSDVTGGQIEPGNIILRRVDANNYYLMRVVVTTGESYQLQVIRVAGGTETFLWSGPTTVAGLTHTNGLTVSIAGMIEGRTVFGKVWLASDPEPYEWQVMVSDDDDYNAVLSPGGIGIRSGVASGNSNSNPRVFTYDNLDVRLVRASVELSELKPDWDETHANKTVALRADGVLRRLGQGKTPVKSSLRRAFETETANPVVAYWSCEDGKDSAVLSSAIEGFPAMEIVAGKIEPASFSKFNCSAPLPLLRKSRWYGNIPPYTPSGAIQLRYLLAIPVAGTTDGVILSQLYTTGTAVRWEAVYHSAGTLSLNAYDIANTQILSSGNFSLDNPNGGLLRLSVELTQTGSNVDWKIATLQVGNTTGFFGNGTLVGYTIGRAGTVGIAVGSIMDDVAFGHITVQKNITSLFDQDSELAAWVGEQAQARALRLCDENNIPFAFFGGQDNGAAMGPQLPRILIDLLQECADTDQSVLHEFRSALGLVFRTRVSMTAQAETLILDYAAGQVAPSLVPASDDQGIRNDIIARKAGGGEYRSTQLTGPRNVNNPGEGDLDAVGRYDDSPEFNVAWFGQLPDAADWALHLGVTTDRRYPSIGVDLAAPDITSAIASAALAVNIVDRVSIRNLTNIDLYRPIDQIAQSYTETFVNSFLHKISFNGTPYSPFEVLVLDDSDGRLDTDPSIITAEALDTTEAGIDVDGDQDEDRFSTDAGDVPFDIWIGGEKITVTSVSGSSWPQTLTVTRSVNGVVKSHVTGVSVSLYSPVYLGR